MSVSIFTSGRGMSLKRRTKAPPWGGVPTWNHGSTNCAHPQWSLLPIATVRSFATVTVGFIFSGSTGMSSNWRNAFDSALHPLVRRCRLIK
jgi:hypothetical protein